MSQTLSDGTNSYTVEKILGSGGFGITYLATDEKLGRKVAIKEYFPGDFAGRDTTHSVVPTTGDQAQLFSWGKERFLDEARMLAGFNHPILLGVLGYFEANNTAYMILPFLDGETLDQRYKRKPFTEVEAKELMLQLIDGLKQIHSVGVLHRDIKPANIILTGLKETPVLIDFGSARSALGQKSNSLTAIVSAPYSPREQYTTVLEQTPATDIYSLGATIYRAMFGSGPPEAIVRDEITELKEMETALNTGSISQEFGQILQDSLRFRASDRPLSVDQLSARIAPSKPLKTSLNSKTNSNYRPNFTIVDEAPNEKPLSPLEREFITFKNRWIQRHGSEDKKDTIWNAFWAAKNKASPLHQSTSSGQPNQKRREAAKVDHQRTHRSPPPPTTGNSGMSFWWVVFFAILGFNLLRSFVF